MERELLKYSAESMDAALREVREGRMTCFAASKTFGVPVLHFVTNSLAEVLKEGRWVLIQSSLGLRRLR